MDLISILNLVSNQTGFDKNQNNRFNRTKIQNYFFRESIKIKCKSLPEALIFASTNPQYGEILFIELQVQYVKIPSSEFWNLAAKSLFDVLGEALCIIFWIISW